MKKIIITIWALLIGIVLLTYSSSNKITSEKKSVSDSISIHQETKKNLQDTDFTLSKH